MKITLREAMEISNQKAKKTTPGQKLIILMLIFIMDETDRDHVTISTMELAVCCQVSQRTVYRLMQGLELRGFVTKTTCRDESGLHHKNTYRINGYKPQKETSCQNNSNH